MMGSLMRPEIELRMFGLLFLLAAVLLLALYALTAPGGDDTLGDAVSAIRLLAGTPRL